MSLAWVLNSLWMLSCVPEARRFQRATRRVASTQETLLREILRCNQNTRFGRRYNFAQLRNVRDYQRHVPLSLHEDYRDDIASIAAGEPNVLTAEHVELLQPTSGTTSGEKLIPYTGGLRRQFQRAVAAWIANLLWHRPQVRRGRAYWSISPALHRAKRTVGGIRIGFDEDAAYLGTLERLALRHLLIVPATLENFRYSTLLALLVAEDLALISVWNPTFLTALFSQFDEWRPRLRDDLRRIAPHRVAVVDQEPQHLWPRLSLISCWTDAAASLSVSQVRSLFPHVEIQPKGLLATEGVVSFPLVDQPAPALAIRSHFFEFEEQSPSGRARLAHEVERGGRYRVILTTGGGLYRYQLRDEVEIVSFLNRCPLLRFLGKADRISDLVGEKLAEVFVRDLLTRAFTARGETPRFALLAPTREQPACYALYLQGIDDPVLLAEQIEEGMRENPHYRYAVELGQLRPVEVRLLPDEVDGWSVYESVCVERGQKVGDVKPASLDAWTGWDERFPNTTRWTARPSSQPVTTSSR
jgi:hypothetical protein